MRLGFDDQHESFLPFKYLNFKAAKLIKTTYERPEVFLGI